MGQIDPVRSPEQLVERAQLERRLAERVLERPEPFLTTVLLRYREGLSAEQIATQQGIPAGTVRSRLKTALDRLRRELDDRDRTQLRVLFAAPLAGTKAPLSTARSIVMAKVTSKLAIVIALVRTNQRTGRVSGRLLCRRDRGHCYGSGGSGSRTTIAQRDRTTVVDVLAVVDEGAPRTFDAQLEHLSRRIGEIAKGGAAERAGLVVGDEVIAVDGRSVDELGSSETMRVITQRPTGATATLSCATESSAWSPSQCALVSERAHRARRRSRSRSHRRGVRRCSRCGRWRGRRASPDRSRIRAHARARRARGTRPES